MAKRRIKKANITFVSLCPRGKNRMPTIYKEDGTVEFSTLLKDNDFNEKGEITAVVYAPEVRDTDGDIASAEVIKQMAYDYMRDGGALDVRHDGKALEKSAAFVAETFLIQKGDSRFQSMQTDDGKVVDVTGGWAMVVKVDDPELRKAYSENGWGGVSIFGKAQVEVEDDKTAEDLRINRIVKALADRLEGKSSDEEIDMTQEELLKALGENNKALTDGIVKGLESVLKKEPEGKAGDETADEGIEFKGDPTNPEDLKKHLAKVEKAKLLDSVDFSDPAALKKLLAKSDEDKDGSKDDESDEVKSLRKKLEKALGKSGQQEGDGKDEESNDIPAGISKEEADQFAIGRKMGAHSNKKRGYATE
ncbi:MAG: hypothetical protein GY906_12955 [bacterium]|nr:hypothetical protein [bacterium]